MRLNNIFLGAFIVLALLSAILRWKKGPEKKSLLLAWPVLVFFILAVFASFYQLNLEGFKYLEKYWSFLLIPMAIFTDPQGFSRKRRYIFLSLLWGCVLTLALCYARLIVDLVSNPEPLDSILRWTHVGTRFTAIADIHPTYLGLFIVSAILFLVLDRGIKHVYKYILLFFLVLGLLQLASRMAILLFVLFLLFFLVNKFMEYRWQVAVLLLGTLCCTALFVAFGDQYLENRLFSSEAITNSRRIERWKVSFQIFRENPFFGVGYAQVKPLRKEKYIESDFPLEAASDFNAHNQFLEYLNSNGALGGFIYTISLFYLLLSSIHRRETLFTFIFFAFIVANLTESMMVRIKGIEYFAIFASLFLCSTAGGKEESNEYLYNTRLRTIFRSGKWNS